MKKYVLVMLISIILMFLLPNCVYSEEKNINDYINQNVNNLNLEDFNNFVNEILNNKINLKEEIKKVINKENNDGFRKILNEIVLLIKENIFIYIPSLIMVIFISLIFMILKNLSSTFLSHEIEKILYFITFSSVLLVTLSLVYSLIKEVTILINDMNTFMQLAFPILITLLSSIGGINSSIAFKPYMSVLTTSITSIINLIVIPLVMGSITIMIVGMFSDKININKLSLFFKSLSKWILTILFSVFVTVLSFDGLTSGIIDTVLIKSTKSAIDNYIPLLGEYLSEGYDLALSSIVIIKNSFGYIVMMLLLFIVLKPVIKIITLSLLFKLCAALIEPSGEKQIVTYLSKMSNSLNLFIGIIIGVFGMFLITVMMIINSLNLGA